MCVCANKCWRIRSCLRYLEDSRACSLRLVSTRAEVMEFEGKENESGRLEMGKRSNVSWLMKARGQAEW